MTIRTDYIHEDKYASLGLAALDRCPVAFLRDEDRPHEYSLTKYLPPALTLAQVAFELDR